MKALKNNLLIILFIFVISSCIFYSFRDNKIIEGNESKMQTLLKELKNAVLEIATEDELKSKEVFYMYDILKKKKDSINKYLELYKNYTYRSMTQSEENPDGFDKIEDVRRVLEKNGEFKKEDTKVTYFQFLFLITVGFRDALESALTLGVYRLSFCDINSKDKKLKKNKISDLQNFLLN